MLTGEGDKAFCSGGDQSVRGPGGYVGDDGVPRLNVLDLQVGPLSDGVAPAASRRPPRPPLRPPPCGQHPGAALTPSPSSPPRLPPPSRNPQVQIRRLPKPVVAQVAGYAVGGGHILHMMCDLTLAADNAVFGQTGPKVGSCDAGRVSTLNLEP